MELDLSGSLRGMSGLHDDDDGDEEENHTAMLWSLSEAARRQTLQIGVSACGATAVVDVLQVLGITVQPQTCDHYVRTKLRRNDSPLPDYLHSRSEAGATHQQLMDGVAAASSGRVTGRFFSFYPARRVRLVAWLAHWIKRGVIPVATMNMQRGVPEGDEVPDAWHHQLIFGVAPNAVFMTNPLDVVTAEQLHVRLCSESDLLIRRCDVIKRLIPDSPLHLISEHQADPRWRTYDVEGQVRRMMEEEDGEEDRVKLTHIKIPAAYSAGITLFTLSDLPVAHKLLATPELSLL